jgi:hypothetical protein
MQLLGQDEALKSCLFENFAERGQEMASFLNRGAPMKSSLITALSLALLTGAVCAQEAAEPEAAPAAAATQTVAAPAPDCAAKATEKKLAGAALDSFMKKCEQDTAKSSCDTSAAEKKLKGAAKNSFVKKCVKDATAH